MNAKTMDERVMDLEKLAESLAPLPARMEAVEGGLAAMDKRLGTVESQIVQLRTEMRVEFSAVRHDLAEGFMSVRTELRADIAAQGQELAGHVLATQREMRVLHEEVIKRIALLGEGRAPEA